MVLGKCCIKRNLFMLSYRKRGASMNEKILWSLSYGLYAIGVEGESYPSACIANTVFQVTAEPVILAVSIHHDNYTHQQIMKHKRFYRFRAV